MIYLLDDFVDDQSLCYSLIRNSIINNKLSHAYLIDGNNYEYAFDFVMAFVKTIICRSHYTNFDKCGNCNICSRIDNGNYTEFKIIETDSMVIKKEQLLDLQNSFNLSSVEGEKRVYVIKDCEKMNKQAANSLLKFLEEPQDNIVAILFTNNFNSLLSTIISRCQIIKLNNLKHNSSSTICNFAHSFCFKKGDIDYFINDDSKVNILNNVVDFINFFENNGIYSFIYLKKIWYNNFSSREENIMALLLIVNFYFDVMKFKYGIVDFYFSSYTYLIENIAKINSIDNIMKKLDICCSKYDDLKYNLNINLFVDDLIIRLGELNECC